MNAGVSFAGTPADDRLSPASWEGHVEVHSLGTSAKSQYRKALEAADSVDPGQSTVSQQQSCEL